MLNYPRNEDNKQVFIDGWDFTPDVGNGKSRGEIFTPRFIVDKMISMGIIPPSIVYNNNYEKFRHGALDNDRFDHLIDEYIAYGAFDHIGLEDSDYYAYRKYSNNMFSKDNLIAELQVIQDAKDKKITDDTTKQNTKKIRDLKREMKKALKDADNSDSVQEEYNKKISDLENGLDTLIADKIQKAHTRQISKQNTVVESVSSVTTFDDALQKLIDDEFIHQNDYDISNYKKFLENDHTVDLVDYDEIIKTTVQEPAVGTGNFSATIAWYKLNVAFLNSQDEDGVFDEDDAIENIIRAMQSLYYFDIDPGNVEVTTRRILGGTDESITSDVIHDYWVSKICDLLEQEQQIEQPDYDIYADTERISKIKDYVSNSLQEAEDKWGVFLKENDSILTRLYNKYFGTDTPDDVMDILMDINDANALIYNGISEFGDETVPGTRKILIQQYKDGIATDVVSLHNYLSEKHMVEIQEEMRSLAEEHATDYNNEDIMSGSIDSSNWDARKNYNAYNKLYKQHEELHDGLDIIELD